MAIFGSVQMNLDIFKFTKEIIIVCIVILYLIDVFKRKIKIKCDIFDSATIAFIVLLIGISIVQEISLK
jgi:Ca2+/Na+ antiporter